MRPRRRCGDAAASLLLLPLLPSASPMPAATQHAALVEQYQSLDRRFVKAQEDHKAAKATVRKLQVRGLREEDDVWGAWCGHPCTASSLRRAGRDRAKQRRRDRVSRHVPRAPRRLLPAMEASLASLEADRATEQAAYDAVLATLKGETEGLRIQMEAQQARLTPAADAAAAASAELETAKTELRLMRDQSEAAGKEHAAAAAS